MTTTPFIPPAFASGWRIFRLELHPDGILLRGAFHPWRAATMTAECGVPGGTKNAAMLLEHQLRGKIESQVDLQARAARHLSSVRRYNAAHHGGHLPGLATLSNCGVYAHYERPRKPDLLFGLQVTAAVIGWGWTQYGERGWRAEHVRIEKLWLPSPNREEFIMYDAQLPSMLNLGRHRYRYGTLTVKHVVNELKKRYQVPVELESYWSEEPVVLSQLTGP